jgi:hypothetical protein
LLQKWLKDASDVEDDAYKTLVLAYNRELDLLVSAKSIIRSDMEKSPPYLEDVMINSKKKNDEFGRHHLNGYTTIYNKFQQTEQPTNGTQFNSICPK